MSIFKYIFQSLKFYWRQHLAVFVGTVISTAVLTGALIVGDSVKLSLIKHVDIRLGNTRFALQTSGRFVNASLADSIADNLNISASPVLTIQGIAINPESENRLNNIQVLGVDNSFWLLAGKTMPSLNQDEVIISSNLAERLNLKEGEELLLRIQNISLVPRNSPFVQEILPSVAIRLTIAAIADDNHLGKFSLKSNQVAPYTVFVSIDNLSEKLGLKGKANSILVSESGSRKLTQNELDSLISAYWSFEDAGLIIRDLSQPDNYEILSDRIFIDQPFVETLDNLGVNYKPVLTYLANSIVANNNETPYSFVSATGLPIAKQKIQNDNIVVNQWLADDLKVKVGDSVLLNYFVVGPLRKIHEVSHKFKVQEIISVKSKSVDASLMPLFPGFADAGSCHDWSADIPIDWGRIRDKDEKYWNEFKGTPKAFISIEDGLKLWGNQYGNYTSLRFNNGDVSKEKLEELLMRSIKPSSLGIYFYPVHSIGVYSAINSVDFGELFLSLSFFVIAAGVLLTILIYTLNTESRKGEVGVLAGLGFDKKLIIKVRIYESVFIALFGSIAGAFLGIVYNNGILSGLNTLWVDAVRTSNLEVFVEPKTITIGAFSGFIIALLSIFILLKKRLKQPVSFLIKRETETSFSKLNKGRFGLLLALLSFLLSIGITIYSLFTSAGINAEMFLTAGGIFMIGGIALFSWFMRHYSNKNYPGKSGFFELAIKNTFKNSRRSLATVTLLALGTFTIIITGANRKTFYGVDEINKSGTGGYTYWAETSLPVEYDLNTEEGRSKVGLEDENLFNIRFIQFPSLDGEDASCLNLNQVQQPRILGINTTEFDNHEAFSFANLMDGVEKEHPWLSLKKDFGNSLIPAFADQTVITWGLKKTLGDTLFYTNENGEKIRLLLVGGLENSIFQGNILICDSLFNQNFPSASGSKVMLVDLPEDKSKDIENILSNSLADYGIEITPTTQRLAEFNSVENTYLAVFMILGGLGVIIGTIGLGIVLLRNMLERKSEIALLSALGYQQKQIFRLVLVENLFLLLTGLFIGFISAIIGVLPSLISPFFVISGGFMFILILIVLVSGMGSIYFPARSAVRSNIIKGLREE